MEHATRNDEPTDEMKLLKALNLLASTIDDQRAIIGPVSRDWVKSEIEMNIRIPDIPLQILDTIQGRDMLAHEIFPDQEIDPNDIRPADIDLEKVAGHIRVNTNRLAKLEPVINAAVLTGILLLGKQKYGRKQKGIPEIENDLIIAAMIYDTLGRKDRFSALLPLEYETVHDQYIRDYLGENVLRHIVEIRRHLEAFESAIKGGTESTLNIPMEYANVLASIAAARLRLTARAAGDRLFSTLDEKKKNELRMAGIETDGEFPEQPYLERDYKTAKAALALKGVDHATIREPLTSTLMTAVQDVLEDASKVTRLCGRRGKALHDVHLNLPMMEYYNAAETPNSLATVYMAAMESMRHLDRGRRKGNGTMLAHSFRIAGIMEQVLGCTTSPIMAAVAILHDIVEDGSRGTIGYDQSLEKVRLRFGGPIAAMVSEVTDSNSKLDGPRKAMSTYYHPALVSPEKQYDVSRFTEMHTKPTDAGKPYTLPGMLTKLVDFLATQEEGIRDPDIMLGWWKHSGIRIFWDQNIKGNVVRPLIERIVLEIKLSRMDVNYERKNDAVPTELLEHICRLLERVLDTADMYMVQNLAILADEYGLHEDEQQYLVAAFTDSTMSREQFENKIFNELLEDARLEARIEAGIVPGKPYVALFKKVDTPPVSKDTSAFMEYRQSALRRQEIRAELGLNTPERAEVLRKKLADVVRLYDLLKCYESDLI
jgi:hypothetical protein